MNKSELTLGNAMRALRFIAYATVVMSTIIVLLMKGFSMMDEEMQTLAYVLCACFLVTPHVTNWYTWLLIKFSSDEE